MGSSAALVGKKIIREAREKERIISVKKEKEIGSGKIKER
jgi:hypothetical protein